MGDTVPINGVMTGPRSARWVPVEPATLVYVEALDKGDIRNEVPHRDRVLTIAAPFTGEPSEVAKTEYRYGGASWTEKGLILLSENDRKTRTTRTWLLNASWAEPRKLWERKQQDQYGNPGSPVFNGDRSTIRQHDNAIYLTGSGASKDGDRPFLDRLDLATFKTERLFRSGDTQSRNRRRADQRRRAAGDHAARVANGAAELLPARPARRREEGAHAPRGSASAAHEGDGGAHVRHLPAQGRRAA